MDRAPKPLAQQVPSAIEIAGKKCCYFPPSVYSDRSICVSRDSRFTLMYQVDVYGKATQLLSGRHVEGRQSGSPPT